MNNNGTTVYSIQIGHNIFNTIVKKHRIDILPIVTLFFNCIESLYSIFLNFLQTEAKFCLPFAVSLYIVDLFFNTIC